jgi:hypothetical protein
LGTVVACAKKDRGESVDTEVKPPIPDFYTSATVAALGTKNVTDVFSSPELDKSTDSDRQVEP